jgi:hypothetical protein
MEDQRQPGNELPTRLREIRALASRFSKLIETANTGAHLVECTKSGYFDDVPKQCVAVDEDWLAMFVTVGSQLGELLHHGTWSPPFLTDVPFNERKDLEKHWAKGGDQLVKAERFVRIANTLVSDFREA